MDVFVLLDKLLLLSAGACAGIITEWRWHIYDRCMAWLEARQWKTSERS